MTIGALAQFTGQPGVLRRDYRLRREIVQQRDLPVGERPPFVPERGNRAP